VIDYATDVKPYEKVIKTVFGVYFTIYSATDISWLSNFKNIKGLSISRSEHELDLTKIDITGLVELNLEGSTKVKVDLNKCPELTSLHIYGNRVDLSPIKNMKRLTDLSLTSMNIPENFFEIITKLSFGKLKHINFSMINNLNNIDFLVLQPNVVTLDLSFTDVSDLRPVRALTKLEALTLKGSRAKEIPAYLPESLHTLDVFSLCFDTE
jgi:hypothetical protein